MVAVVLGILATLAEGFGIALFIPFLQAIGDQSSDPESGSRLVAFMTGLFGDNLQGKLPQIAFCIFGALVVKAILSYAAELSYAILDARLGHEVRVGLHDQLLGVGYSFIENTRDERLVNTLTSESWKMTKTISVVVYLIVMTATLAVYTAMLLLISWKLTIIVAVSMFTISRVVRLLRRRVEVLGRVGTWSNLRLTGRMLEALYGNEAIRTNGMEQHSATKFNNASERVSSSFLRLAMVSGLVGPIYEVFTAGLLVILLFVSFQNAESIPAILVFIFILHRLQPKIRALDGTWLAMESMKAPVNEVLWLLDKTDKPYIASGKKAVSKLRSAIRFDDVSFSYSPSRPQVLSNVNLEIAAGSTTALVGPSGAGKSTLIKLILRFYEPVSGTIQVDGVDLNDLDSLSWKRRLAVVSQDPYVFNTSVYDNIAFGHPDADPNEVTQAAIAANAHDFIMELPRGYRTVVGDDGALLSGGQKQRLAMARALVRKPDVLILDEATNALDSISEAVIQQALANLPEHCTKIIIAHRLSSIESADQIVVFKNARIHELGTFAELVDRNGLFAEMYRHQAGEEQGFS